MGMSDKKTTSKETSKATTTPQVAPWMSDILKGYANRVQQFGQGDPSQLVPGPSPLQNQAFQRAMAMAQRGAPQAQPAPPQGGGLGMIAPQQAPVMQAQPQDTDMIERLRALQGQTAYTPGY